ncbi:MAG TPA: VOC family protein [Pyrinomonadaceae bacterium]|jgi:PhnB protein|nr:VOC family protein [Pyrinomonadaceae bacterium]
MHLNPYLLFNGNCAEAFKFYEQTLGGKIEALMTFNGSPAAEHAPPEWGDKILHASMTIGDQRVMASDAPPGQYKQPQGISVSIGLNDRDKGERIFNALAEGGTTTMPFAKTFWASGFGMCTDRFGIPWMVNCE